MNNEGQQSNTEYSPGPAGHPIVYWPGWITNPARYSDQPDIMPLPIVPVRHQTWTFYQPQLSNGWQQTNYGLRMSYDDYLRLLSSSASGPGYPPPMPGQGLQPQGSAMPSQLQQQQMISANAPLLANNQQGGTGVLAPGVNLAGRTYYG